MRSCSSGRPPWGRSCVTRGGYPWSVCTGGQVNSSCGAVVRSVILLHVSLVLQTPDTPRVKQAAAAGRSESRRRFPGGEKPGGVRSPHPRSSSALPRDSHARRSWARCVESVTTRPFSHAKRRETRRAKRLGARRPSPVPSYLPAQNSLGGEKAAGVWAEIRRPYVQDFRLQERNKIKQGADPRKQAGCKLRNLT